VHFDRWWNPAVENQATDRAFRIGQKKNVLVHKFVCRGTLEEKIDAMIEAKRQMSDELLHDDGSVLLTELNDQELVKLVTLDINKALGEM
jgi:non-specific serine/threonine protein kinase